MASSSPIVLDLDGDSIEITPEASSNIFYDTANDGYQHRTAWAGAGDAVLAIDADGDGKIDQRNEIVFTDWDPSAKSDMQAIRSVFDSNDDGLLDKNDDRFDDFKVVITNADGTTTTKSLVNAGIESIDLKENETEIALPDGSVITGQTTFTRSDKTTGTAATVSLATDANGYKIDHTETTDKDGTTITNVAKNADGSLASKTTTWTNTTGTSRTTTFDWDGDGVVDQIEDYTKEIDIGTGDKTETVANKTGGGVLIDATVTTTSADGKTITIERDQTGGGYISESETRVTDISGYTLTQTALNPDASAYFSVTKVVSSDGLTRTDSADLDGNGTTDITTKDQTVVAGDKSRTETISHKSNDGSLIDQVVILTSTDGQSRTVTSDLDGDGKNDFKEVSGVVVNMDDSTTTTLTKTNGDGTAAVRLTVVDLSSDGLLKTTQTDLDGDAKYDLKTTDNTVVSGTSGEIRTQTVSNYSGSGALLGRTVTIKNADGITRTIQADMDGDGNNNLTEVIAVGAGSTIVDTLTHFANDGLLINQTKTTSSSTGLSKTTEYDLDGNGIFETIATDVTVIDISGNSTETVTVSNADNSMRSKQVSTASVDGLSKSTTFNYNGDGIDDDLSITDVTVVDVKDGSYVQTITEKNSDNSVRDSVVKSVSGDRREISVDTDVDGDTVADQAETIIVEDTGLTVDTVSHYAPGAVLKYQTIVSTSANKLVAVAEFDFGGDADIDLTIVDSTVLVKDGSSIRVVSEYDEDGVLLDSAITTMSANKLIVEAVSDVNGDGKGDLTSKDTTALNADGSTTRTVTRSNTAGKIDETVTSTSATGLSVTTQVDADGNGAFDTTRTDVVVLNTDGSKIETVIDKNADASTRGQTVTQTSADKKTVTVTRSLGDTKAQTETMVLQANGDTVDTVITLATDGSAISTVVTTTSANGLFASVVVEDATGTPVDTKVAATVLNLDGSRTTTITEDGAVDGNVVTTVSDDGLTTVTDTKLTGTSMNYTAKTADITLLNNDGSKTRTVSLSDTDGALLAKTTVVTSDDGLSTTTTIDRDGNQTSDCIHTTVTDVDGSKTETYSLFADSGRLLSADTATTSADGRTTVVQTDADGNGVAERTETTVKNADGSVTTTIVSSGAFGAPAFKQVIFSDLDTDGSTTTKVTDYSTDGSVLDETFTRVSANGLTATSLYDTNGDGVTDLTRSDVTMLNDDGSTTETETFTYRGNVSAAKTVTTTSADGLTTYTTVDSDGNGFSEFTYLVKAALDGSEVDTRTLYDNKTGTLIEKETTTLTAGGLITKDNSKGFVDTTSIFTGAEGSYEWVRKVGATLSGTSSHAIDANGIDTWSWNIVDATSWATTTADKTVAASGTIQIDLATEQEYVDFAKRLFAVGYDRSISSDEVETLGQYIQDGEFNKALLATNIMASSEWTAIYGVNITSSDIGFVDVVYANVFGHVPAKEVSDYYLKQLNAGNMARTDVLVAIAESMSGGQVTRNGVHTQTGSSTGDYSNDAGGVYVNLLSWATGGEATGDMHFFELVNLIGTDFDDDLRGNNYNNVLVGGKGADLFQGNGGTDTISYLLSSAGVNANLTTGVGIGGDAEGDTYFSSENLIGSAFADTLTGFSTVNDIAGGAGNDTLDGGAGTDTASYRDSSAGVTVDLTAGTGKGGDAEGDKLSNFENLVGSAFSDALTGSSIANVLDGGAGNDTLTGGAGNDTYLVDSAADVIVEAAAGGTADLVQSTAANFTLSAEVENLTLMGRDNINGVGNAAVNVITGNEGNNKLEGGAANDTLHGGLGDDALYGSSATAGDGTVDWLYGDEGNDSYYVWDAADATWEYAGGGIDTVYAYCTYALNANYTTNGLVENGVAMTAGITLTGNGLDNRLTADASLTGGVTLDGGAGNDILVSGKYGDTLTGGTGTADVASYANASAGVTASLNAALGITATGDAAGDSYATIEGLTGSAFSDELYAATTASTLDGGAGNDKLHGGAGNDIFVVDSVGDQVTDTVGGTADLVQSTAASFTLATGSGIEKLTLIGNGSINGTGNELVNTITGNDRANTLDGGTNTTGVDTLAGGKGDDILVVRNAGDVTLENKDEGTDTVQAWVTYTLGNTWSNTIENLTLMGSSSINGTGNWLDNVITGNGGDNALTGADGNDTLIGGAGNDTLTGGVGTADMASYANATSGVTASLANTALNTNDAKGDSYVTIEGLIGSSLDDTLYAASTASILNGGAGNDQLYGGAANDTFIVDNTADKVTDAAGGSADLVQSTAASYTLATGNGVEKLTLIGNGSINGTGNELVNTIIGNDRANTLDGGANTTGVDTLAGGKGDDILIVRNVGDVTLENKDEGNDTVQAWVAYTLGNTWSNTIENLTLMGSSNINGTGNWLDNVITGNGGDNALTGADGNDTLIGGAGGDTLTGGVGTADTASYANATLGVTASLANTALNTNDAKGDSYVTIEGLIGSSLDDTLYAASTASILNGGAGNDQLYGGAGNDMFIVDNTADKVTDTTGGTADLVQSTAASFTLATGNGIEKLTLIGNGNISGTGNELVNTITGNDGANTLDGGTNTTGVDTLAGGKGDDILIVRNAGDITLENKDEGTDTVQAWVTYTLGNTWSNTIENLTLMGSSNINGTGNWLDNVITGNGGNNVLDGAAGHDDLRGGAGNDTLTGGAGNDLLNGGLGNDILDGTSGTDTATYADAAGSVSVTLNGTAGFSSGAAGVDTLKNIANLIGSGFDDQLTGDTTANQLQGGLGNDLLSGGGNNDRLIGGDGDDVLEGGTSNDLMDGGNGSDWASYAASASAVTVSLVTHVGIGGDAAGDTLHSIENLQGSANADTLVGDDGANMLKGGAGNDTLDGKGGVDTADYSDSSVALTVDLRLATAQTSGGTASGDILSNIENLIGGAGNDTFTGTDGDNRLDGGAGNDNLIGGKGNDIYVVNAAGDSLTEAASEGIDTVEASVNWTLGTNFENLTLTGAGNLTGTGNAVANIILGNNGNNTLSGADGNDILDGGAGNDTLTGGQGADEFRFGRTGGADIVDAYDTDGGADKLSVGVGVAEDQLWFTQSGNDLIMTIIGTNDKVTIQGWYSSTDRQLNTIQLSDGKYATASDVEALRTAMAAFSPPALGQTTLDPSALQSLNVTLAASWQ